MTDDETVIRELLQEWAKAVHQGDMPGVLMDHAKDIVMFDVPPPDDGCAVSGPTARPGHPSSSGSAAGRPSRSSTVLHR